MKKLIVFTEDQYNKLLIKFSDQLIEDQKIGRKGGYKVVSRDTVEDMLEKEKEYMYGALMMVWDKVFR